MDNLGHAIDQLVSDIGSIGYWDGIVNAVAEEYEIHPQLLERKFKDKYKVAPSEYVNRRRIEFSRDHLLEQARKAWHDNNLEGSPEDHFYFGLEFRRDSQDWIAVAWTGASLIVINKETAAPWKFSWYNTKVARKALKDMGLDDDR